MLWWAIDRLVFDRPQKRYTPTSKGDLTSPPPAGSGATGCRSEMSVDNIFLDECGVTTDLLRR